MPNISKITLPDGETYNLVATGSDTKVTQTATSTNADYEVLFSNSANNTTETAEARKSEGLLFNPYKSAFTAGSRASNSTIGSYSTVNGYDCTASGYCAYAEGYDTDSTSYYSHSEGRNTNANGYASHSGGYVTYANGNYSFTHGQYLHSNHRSQFVFGEYNIADDSTEAANSRGNYIEIIGNGTGTSARSNARTLDWDGNEVLAGTLETPDVVKPTGSTWDGTNTSLTAAMTNKYTSAVVELNSTDSTPYTDQTLYNLIKNDSRISDSTITFFSARFQGGSRYGCCFLYSNKMYGSIVIFHYSSRPTYISINNGTVVLMEWHAAADAVKLKSFRMKCSDMTTNMDLSSYIQLDTGYHFLSYQTLATADGWVPTFPIYLSSPDYIQGRPWWNGNLTSSGYVKFWYYEVRNI